MTALFVVVSALTLVAAPSKALRQHFLEMFARAYVPGRSGQLLFVPQRGDFITRPDPYYTMMHGSPWPYDVEIPILFAGPAVIPGRDSIPAVQQDIAPTLAAALGTKMPFTATGHALPVLRKDFARPRVVMLLVLDGMRRDYFDRHASLMPTLTALRHRGAWFTRAHVNVLPSNTAVGHSTISTGTDPWVHGITGVSTYDFTARKRLDMYAGCNPKDLWTWTLADAGSARPRGVRSFSRKEASTGRRRPWRDTGRVSPEDPASCSRATTSRPGRGTRTRTTIDCPTT